MKKNNGAGHHRIFMVLQFAILGSILLLGGCTDAGSLEKPLDLSLNEGFKDPIGFYDDTPVFSWKLPQNIKVQSAYRIVVASKPELLPNSPDLWDSGKIVSDRSLYVPYGAKPLSSGDKVFWQVQFWDGNGSASQWSDTAFMELGLLRNSDWGAQWIGLDTKKDSIKGRNNISIHTPQLLRKDFELKTQVTEAKLYVTAKGVFTGKINGKAISDDVMAPGWTPYDKRIESMTYDVTDLVQEGENTIGFQLASGWHFGRMLWNKMIWGSNGSPKLLAQLKVLYADGSVEQIVSDGTWTGTTKGPIRFSEIYDGEIYDANMELPGWASPKFNADNWSKVETMPISPKIAIVPKRHHAVRNKLVLPTQSIIKPKEGKAVIFNLEQNMVGVPKLRVPMKKGDTLKIRFSEMLDPDGTFYTDNYRSAKSTDYYIASKDGLIDWNPTFTFHGFQYVELSGFDATKTPDKDWVSGLVQYSDFDANGTFTSSHDKLNQLQNNIVWGLRGNFFDIPTDCPQRDERLGWTGDAQVFAPTSMFNAKVYSFWASWLQTLRESQFKNGGVPFVAPDVLKNDRASSGWGDAAVIIPWDLYRRTGDTTVLSENYQMMKNWVAYHETQTAELISDMNSFGDWLQPFQSEDSRKRGDTSKNLIGTAFFAHAANLTSKAAEVLGKTQEATSYHNLYKEVAKAFENEFFDAEGKIKNGTATQTGYLLALDFELLSDAIEEKAKGHLITTISEADNHLRTGFLGTPLLPRVLDAMGETDLMYGILMKETYPSWFYSINQGATTMWERWNSYSRLEGYNPESMNSLNHYAYGAVGEWMYERIAGIQPLEPGYKKIRIAPLPGGGLTSAGATYDSPYGVVRSSWHINGDTFYLEAEVPPNTTGVISIPTREKESVLVNGQGMEQLNIVSSTDKTENTLTFQVSAGTYSIQANLD